MVDLQNYKNLDPLARALLFRNIKDEEKVSYQKIARRIKKSSSYVANSIRLLNLPIAIKDGIIGGLISEGHARALVAIRDQRDCVEIYKEVLKSHGSVRETEEMVRQKLKTGKARINKSAIALIKKSLEKIIKQKFKEIKVKETRRKLQITLTKP